MRELIFKKLSEHVRTTPSVNKFFIFNIDDLENDPEKCLNLIDEHIEKHKDKIEDIEFESWIDDETFCPVIMLKMYPVKSIADHLGRSQILYSLLPSSTEAELLREDVQNILAKYEWKFNEDTIRKSILQEIGFSISVSDIIDKTTNENVDSGVVNFVIQEEGKEITISEYLENVAAKKRFE